jgi:hypothetical protein
MPTEVVSSPELSVADAELVQTWLCRQEFWEKWRRDALMKGTLLPSTPDDWSDIQLREKLRRRGLFNERVLCHSR